MMGDDNHFKTGDAQGRVACRTSLPVAMLIELDSALMEAFAVIQALRKRNRASELIKFPPLPSCFSESLVIAAAPRLFGAEWQAGYGGNECDVLLRSAAGMRKRVEVKATGRHAFQELKGKDLQADILVWVRFGCRYETGHGSIQISVLENPGRYIQRACRLDTVRFQKIPGVAANQRVLTFATLPELLSIQTSDGG